MAEGTLQILGLGTSAVPLEYTVPGNQPLDLIAVKADFDGSGAGADFAPVVEIISSAGKIMAQSIGDTVTAGDSATVTFAPFLNRGGVSTAKGFIRFDFLNQGGALDIHTKNSVYSNTGFHVSDESTLGIRIIQDANGPIIIDATGNGGLLLESDGNGQLNVLQTGNGGLAIEDFGNGGTQIVDTGNGGLYLNATNASTIIDMTNTNDLRIPGLPTMLPGTPDTVWNNGGVLNIT